MGDIFDTKTNQRQSNRGYDGSAFVLEKPRGVSGLGYQQITSLGSAVGLTVPTGATLALIQAEAQDIRWRDDGSNPTASIGMYLAAGNSVYYVGPLATFKAIEVTSGAILNILYYS